MGQLSDWTYSVWNNHVTTWKVLGDKSSCFIELQTFVDSTRKTLKQVGKKKFFLSPGFERETKNGSKKTNTKCSIQFFKENPGFVDVGSWSRAFLVYNLFLWSKVTWSCSRLYVENSKPLSFNSFENEIVSRGDWVCCWWFTIKSDQVESELGTCQTKPSKEEPKGEPEDE